MAYKHKHDHRYQLINVFDSYSKSGKSKGKPMKTIVFHNLDLNRTLETYVVVSGQHKDGTWVDGFKNERHWETIIKNFDIAKDYIITFNEHMTDQYGNKKDFQVKCKKEKDEFKYIINADAHPETDMSPLSSFKPVAKPVEELPVKQFDSPLFDIAQ